MGYMAPEYGLEGTVSRQGDKYQSICLSLFASFLWGDLINIQTDRCSGNKLCDEELISTGFCLVLLLMVCSNWSSDIGVTSGDDHIEVLRATPTPGR
ncbi:hypothetical protein L6164_008190 [Bauhinia variegata]|uniref:Uncharacterized protein n=1 Tax=Bauhinia variegata TaxID=167791 RepID=A0ACB9PHA0_BAUVA|nr:hypothetical protein L6164_008190 [Bauhinia variegata]